MIEVPARVVESRGAHRCSKCWSWLRIVDAHPLRLEQGNEEATPVAARTGGRNRLRNAEEDDDS